MRIGPGEVGEEGNECFIVGTFVGGEAPSVELPPARIIHVIDEERAVESKSRPALQRCARRDKLLQRRFAGSLPILVDRKPVYEIANYRFLPLVYRLPGCATQIGITEVRLGADSRLPELGSSKIGALQRGRS